MEKLRKAMERARNERSGGAAGESTVRASSPPPPPDLDAYAYTNTRVFVPDADLLERNRVLGGGAATPVADAFRMLRTQVVQRMGEHGWRTLSVVSPGRGDGRTLTAVNLAVMLAADPRYSVLLCDLDLRAPGIAELFGLKVEQGVDDVLSGRAAVKDCLVHPQGYDRLVLLPARGPLARSSEFLASAATVDLVAELRDRYPDRILIFDLPPVLSSDDALAFTPHTDCALLIVAEGATRREDVVRTMEILHNTPVLGTLLNRSMAGKSAAA
jgi:protein-tyrosine kinase